MKRLVAVVNEALRRLTLPPRWWTRMENRLWPKRWFRRTLKWVDLISSAGAPGGEGGYEAQPPRQRWWTDEELDLAPQQRSDPSKATQAGDDDDPQR